MADGARAWLPAPSSGPRCTSRNSACPLRRAIARRDPELLSPTAAAQRDARRATPIASHSAVRLRLRPERRVAQIAQARRTATVVANFHGSTRVPLAEDELERLVELALAARRPPPAPVVLGGDLNLRDARTSPGMEHVAARDVDHVFAAGLRRRRRGAALRATPSRRGTARELSDHPPLVAELWR